MPSTKWDNGLNSERHQSGLRDAELFPDDEVSNSPGEESAGLIRRGSTALNLITLCLLEEKAF